MRLRAINVFFYSLCLGVWVVFSTQTLTGAELIGITPESMEVRRGDRVVLRVATKGDQFPVGKTTVGQPTVEQPTVEWWSEGRVICKGDVCEIDTSSFTPGYVTYDVLIEDSKGVVTTQVTLRALDAEPLYIPRYLTPDVDLPRRRPTFIANGQWFMIKKSGGLTYAQGPSPKDIQFEQVFSTPRQQTTYTVSTNGAVVLRRLGFAEQMLINPRTKFVLNGTRIEIKEGQVLWRSSASKNDPRVGEVEAGLRLKALGSAFVGIDVGFLPTKGRRVVIHNFQSKQLTLHCGQNQQPILVKSRQARMAEINDGFQCKKLTSDIFIADDPMSWAGSWSPWWSEYQSPGPIDRWRFEYAATMTNKLLPELLAEASAYREREDCATVLDLLKARQSSDNQSVERLSLLGQCQFELGIYRQSLLTFLTLNELQSDSPWSAFMTGQSYQLLKKHDLASRWFWESRRRGYAPVEDLARLALTSADEQQSSLERLRWLDVLCRDDFQSKRGAQDCQKYNRFLTDRLKGARIKASVLMDSHGRIKESNLTDSVEASPSRERGIVSSMEGAWWWGNQLTLGSTLKLHGVHDLSMPISGGAWPRSMSRHTLGMQFKVNDRSGGSVSNVSPFVVALGGRVGVGLLSGSSQRDQYGWTMSVLNPDWLGLYVEIESDKYLDPNPGGADVIDMDLDRYTGSVDHSHVDFKISVGLREDDPDMPWTLGASYKMASYSTTSMVAYGHTQWVLTGSIDRRLSSRWDVGFQGQVINRTFTRGGRDQIIGVVGEGGFRMTPLWRLGLKSGLERRDVTDDEAATWNRQYYGLFVSTEI
jgi:hypothetical protein